MKIFERALQLVFSSKRKVRNSSEYIHKKDSVNLSRFEAAELLDESKYKCMQLLGWDHPNGNMFGILCNKEVCVCAHCGRLIEEYFHSNSPIGFCSSRCKNEAIKNHKMHAMRVNSLTHFITRLELYIRDNATCGICGNHVEMCQVSIDHIVPVSKGGRHVWDNVQLAHYLCNMRKSNQELSELSGGEKCVQGLYVYTEGKAESEDVSEDDEA